MESKKTEELSAEELEQVSGGRLLWKNYVTKTTEVVRRDSKGNPTHWRVKCQGVYQGEPFYYVCPSCGRLLHEGTLDRLHCDSCDESWLAPAIRESCQRYGIYSGR